MGLEEEGAGEGEDEDWTKTLRAVAEEKEDDERLFEDVFQEGYGDGRVIEGDTLKASVRRP